MILEAHVKLYVTESDFPEFFIFFFFAPKIGEMEQKWVKNRVF